MGASAKKAAFVNAFIESVIEAFESMVGARPHRTHVAATPNMDAGYGTSSVGAMVMTTAGPMLLCFSKGVALRIMSALTGVEMGELNNEVLDGTRELANILTGSAKSRLDSQNLNIEFELPQTRLGAFVKVDQKPNDYWITIQFDSDAGQFFIQVPYMEALFKEPAAGESPSPAKPPAAAEQPAAAK